MSRDRDYRVRAVDGSEADKQDIHLPGMWSLDTTTLCGFTWLVERQEGMPRVTCKLCIQTLDEMREVVRSHRNMGAMSRRMSERRRIEAALDRIAACLDCGELLLATDQAAFLEAAADLIERAPKPETRGSM